MLRRLRCRDDRGQELVEYVLILPVLMLFLLGIMEFGIVVFAYDSVANVAREGARYGIIHPEDSAGIEATARASATGLNPAALQFTITRSGRTIRVEVTYNHNLITAPIIQAVGGNPTLQLHTAATMQIE
jgi:Flp pilus assembly protein TadG